MCMLGDISAVYKQHLVSLNKLRYTVVTGTRSTYLFMCMLGDISAIDKQHLVSFIKARYTVVCWRIGGHPWDDDRHALVGPTLHIEAKAPLFIRDHPEGNQTLAIKETIAIRLKWQEIRIFTSRQEFSLLAFKAPITTAAEDIFWEIFPNLKKKIRYDISWESSDDSHEILCLICYFEKAAKFEIVVCCKL